MLPHVVRINGKAVDHLYGELCSDIQLDGKGTEALASRLEELQGIADLPLRLSDCQINELDLTIMAQEATEQWTGTFNPLPLREQDFLKLYKAAL